MKDNVAVVVRSIGERTTDVCEKLLSNQVPEENLFRVDNLSYENHISRTYEIGIEEDLKWTLVVDADVIPRSNMVRKLVMSIESEDQKLFAAEGGVLDKFFGGTRNAGNTIYRTDLLKHALQHIPKDESCPRPETTAILAMQDEGYPAKWDENLIVGLHEYEQSFPDIYRKGSTFVGKRKHYVPVLQPYWKRQANTDPDFKLLLRMCNRALLRDDSIRFEAKHYQTEDVDSVLRSLGLSKKEPLSPNEFSQDWVEDVIAHTPPPEYYRVQRLANVRESDFWEYLPVSFRYLIISLLQKPIYVAVPWTIKRVFRRTYLELTN